MFLSLNLKKSFKSNSIWQDLNQLFIKLFLLNPHMFLRRSFYWFVIIREWGTIPGFDGG